MFVTYWNTKALILDSKVIMGQCYDSAFSTPNTYPYEVIMFTHGSLWTEPITIDMIIKKITFKVSKEICDNIKAQG